MDRYTEWYYKKYTNRVHRTTGMKPIDIRSNTQLKVYNNPKIVPKHKFKIGDIVRIRKHKAVFDKGYISNYSTELFTITKINITNPVTCLLEDMEGSPIKGCFYELELLKTKYSDTYFIEQIKKRKGRRIFARSVL